MHVWSREENHATQERFTTEVVDGGRVDVIDEVTNPDFVDLTRHPTKDRVPRASRPSGPLSTAAFPDIHVSVEHLTADDDSIAIAYRAQGPTRAVRRRGADRTPLPCSWWPP